MGDTLLSGNFSVDCDEILFYTVFTRLIIMRMIGHFHIVFQD